MQARITNSSACRLCERLSSQDLQSFVVRKFETVVQTILMGSTAAAATKDQFLYSRHE